MVEAAARRDERAILACAVLIATGIAAGELAVPNDLFWHLAIAREVWHHGFPRSDPFAFSTNGIAWSPPEWIGELAYGAAYVSIGWAGTTLLTLGAIALCFYAIVRAARSVAPAPAATLAVLVFAGPASVHLPMRPLVLGDAFLAIGQVGGDPFAGPLQRLSQNRVGSSRQACAVVVGQTVGAGEWSESRRPHDVAGVRPADARHASPVAQGSVQPGGW